MGLSQVFVFGWLRKHVELSRLPNLSNLPKGSHSLSLSFALPAERIVLVGAQNVTWSTFQCRDVPSHFSSQIVSDTFHRQDNVIGFFPAQPVSETLHASNPIANSCTLSISQSYIGKSFQKHFFCIFFLSVTFFNMYTSHTYSSILICFKNSYQDPPSRQLCQV